MRDKVVLGFAKDFRRAGTHAGPSRICDSASGSGSAACVEPRSARSPGRDLPQARRCRRLAAQALNRLAAPIGAECGGAKYRPGADRRLAGARRRRPAGPPTIAGRRLGITYGGFTSASPATRPRSPPATAVGIDLVLRRDAQGGDSLGRAPQAGTTHSRRCTTAMAGQRLGRLSVCTVGLEPSRQSFPDSRQWPEPTAVRTPGPAIHRWSILPVRLAVVPIPTTVTVIGATAAVSILSPGWG